MPRPHRLPLLLPLVLLAACGTPSVDDGAADPLERARRATVALELRGHDAEGGWVSHAAGSIVDAGGYVVTCEHVTVAGEAQHVLLQDGRRLPYRVVARAGGSFDLAVLAVDPDGALPVMPFGDDGRLEVGNRVTILGNPEGVGIRALDARLRRVDAGGGTQLETVEANVVPGFSGGPVLDAQGRMIAHVHVAIRGQAGVARHVRLAHLRRAFREWLWEGPGRPGLRIACDGGPARVLAVRPGSEAERGGLSVGDRITQVDGESVADGMAAVLRLLDRTTGLAVPCEVLRAGRRHTVLLAP